MARINENMAQLIKAQMLQKKLNQATLSKKMGLSVITLNHKINGKQALKLPEIVLLMNFLKLEPGVFIK